MTLQNSYCSPEEVVRNAKCLLGRVEEVRCVLHLKGFSENAIEHAVTVVYRVAMPYINGTKICKIDNRRAWVFRVAIRAAIRTANREVRCQRLEPLFDATIEDSESGEELFSIPGVLKQLTKKQSDAIDCCVLRDMSLRAAAKEMGIAAGTLGEHVNTAKERLKEILSPLLPPGWPKHFHPSALAT